MWAYPYTYQYTVDSTYTVRLIAAGDCNYDTLYTTITVGCAGSPGFQHAISADDHQICVGETVTLSITNPLPPDYSLQWEKQGSFGVFYPMVGDTNTSVTVAPAGNAIYRNKAICRISGNHKLSNVETIYVTPAPTVTGIQVHYLAGNNWQMEGTGVQHTQAWFWDFGDGDTSHAESPLHQYAGAGTYTVRLIVSDTLNGCTDTATTTIMVTGVEEAIGGSGVRLYPNPASAILIVEYTGAGWLALTDLTGRLQHTWRLPAGSHRFTADLSDLASGVYLYTVRTAGNRLIRGKLSVIP